MCISCCMPPSSVSMLSFNKVRTIEYTTFFFIGNSKICHKCKLWRVKIKNVIYGCHRQINTYTHIHVCIYSCAGWRKGLRPSDLLIEECHPHCEFSLKQWSVLSEGLKWLLWLPENFIFSFLALLCACCVCGRTLYLLIPGRFHLTQQGCKLLAATATIHEPFL